MLVFARVVVQILKNRCYSARFCLWWKSFSTERCSLREKCCLNFTCPEWDSILLTVCKHRAAYGYTNSLCLFRAGLCLSFEKPLLLRAILLVEEIIFYRAVFPTGKMLFKFYMSRMGQHFNNRMQAPRNLRLYKQPLFFARVVVQILKNRYCSARFCLWW